MILLDTDTLSLFMDGQERVTERVRQAGAITITVITQIEILQGRFASILKAADAEQLYRLLEEEVVPLFYERDARGVPLGWVDKMKHALRVAGGHFTARRMVQQYVTDYYVPAIQGQLAGDDPPAA